jgi:non-canonical poly(A) RNA polymerase PAPD5/7
MAQESRNSRRDDRNSRRPSRDYNDRDRRDNRDRRDQRDYRSHAPSSDSYRPSQSDFTFRAEKPSGVQDFSVNDYRGNNQRSNDRRDHGPSRRGARGSRGRGDTFRGRGGRQPRRIFIPSERELLSGNHAAEPELDLSKTGVKYRALEDLSDSDEADMDISGDEGDGSGQEPSRKRTRTSLSSAAGNAVPKWSNPDPYTAIPPESATQAKKKDVVAMIRKARVTTTEEAVASIPTEAADFISCDFDSTEPEESEPEEEQEVVGAPAPRGGGRAAVDMPTRDPYTSALGSRKRTHDDVIKVPSVKLGRPAGPEKHCDVLREWCEKSSEDPTPWLKMTHASSVKPAVRHVSSQP